MAKATTLTTLLESLDDENEGAELSIDEIVRVIGDRGYGPLVLILGLIATLPTGAVPGVPSVCGICIALVSAQLAAGKRYPWLPKRLRRVSIKRQRYAQVTRRITPWTRKLDKLVRPRLSWLAQGVSSRVIGLGWIGLGLCMIPLELIPFAAAAPASAITLMAMGLTGKDGAWVLAGMVPALGALYFLTRLLGG